MSEEKYVQYTDCHVFDTWYMDKESKTAKKQKQILFHKVPACQVKDLVTLDSGKKCINFSVPIKRRGKIIAEILNEGSFADREEIWLDAAMWESQAERFSNFYTKSCKDSTVFLTLIGTLNSRTDDKGVVHAKMSVRDWFFDFKKSKDPNQESKPASNSGDDNSDTVEFEEMDELDFLEDGDLPF